MPHVTTHADAAPASPRPPGDLNPRREPVLDFPDRDFGELSPADYHTLGFMGGLEVHQQLATTSKLFCRCPAGRRVTAYDAEVLRHMRPTLSELGEYDGTALMEFKTKKEIVYQLERGSRSAPTRWMTRPPSRWITRRCASPSRSRSCSTSTWCPSCTSCASSTWTAPSPPASSARRWWAWTA